MRVAFAVAVVCTMGVAPPASAEAPEAQVERLAEEALNAYKGADYKRAVELLQRAYEIRQVAALLYNLGKAYDKLGDLDKAYDAYRRYVDSAAADPRLKERAEARLLALTDAKRKKTEAEHALEPKPQPAEVEPPKPPPLSPEAQRARAHDDFVRKRHRARVITIALGGATVVFAAVAIGLAVDALSLQSRFDQAVSPSDKSQFKSDAVVRAGVADGFFAATAATAAVTGYFLYLSFRPERQPPSLAWLPLATPNGVGLTMAGRF
jgi:tetratricopeptide (TPR) repeat protein